MSVATVAERARPVRGVKDGFWRRHPGLMLLATVALAVAAVVALLSAGAAEPILYQGF
jgi:hypothetical protein